MKTQRQITAAYIDYITAFGEDSAKESLDFLDHNNLDMPMITIAMCEHGMLDRDDMQHNLRPCYEEAIAHVMVSLFEEA